MFLEDTDPDKRNKLIDRLLDSPQYADFFANKWNSVLRNRGANESFRRGTFAMHSWIRQSLYENKPYDQFVREIIAATGGVAQNPAVVWYRSVREMNEQVEDTAQLFLGMRLQCARCHHHPFEKWSQQDYYSMAAFFSRVGRKPGGEPSEERIFHKYGTAQATNPKTHQKVVPAGLDAEPRAIAAETDPRQRLVDWMADPSNPFLAKALVNRYWKHFFNHGLVEPEDDMRVTNPPANPELLEAMAKYFVANKFDLKQLIRVICQSKTYQLSSEPNDYNVDDKQNFSRYYPKRLTAEVLLDAINQVTSTGSAFSGLPAGTRAVELADSRMGSYFLTVFGRPEGTSACECERSGEANLAQSLHMLNSAEIQSKLSADKGRAANLAQDTSRSDVEKVTDLYLRLYSRSPSEEELQVALRYIAAKKENLRIAYEDILWALLNTKEFLFNH